jgi:uncharacterized protein YndB with AHSA1/START domain
MAKLTRSITVHAPVDQVFDYALDIRNLWNVKDVALAEVDIKPEGVGTTARMYSHFLGFHLEGGVEYTEVVPGQRIVAKVHFFMEEPTWTFTFHPVKAGTKLTIEGEWNVRLPIAGRPIESMMVKEHEPFVDELLGNIRTAVEAKAAA